MASSQADQSSCMCYAGTHRRLLLIPRLNIAAATATEPPASSTSKCVPGSLVPRIYLNVSFHQKQCHLFPSYRYVASKVQRFAQCTLEIYQHNGGNEHLRGMSRAADSRPGTQLAVQVLNRHSTQNAAYQIGISYDMGARRTMEDSHSFVVDFAGVRGQGFFAVFDGHAGKHAAEWCGRSFHEVCRLYRSAPPRHLTHVSC